MAKGYRRKPIRTVVTPQIQQPNTAQVSKKGPTAAEAIYQESISQVNPLEAQTKAMLGMIPHVEAPSQDIDLPTRAQRGVNMTMPTSSPSPDFEIRRAQEAGGQNTRYPDLPSQKEEPQTFEGPNDLFPFKIFPPQG